MHTAHKIGIYSQKTGAFYFFGAKVLIECLDLEINTLFESSYKKNMLARISRKMAKYILPPPPY